jgi:hypothetical protein
MTDTIESLNALAEETSDKRLEDELAAKAKQPGVKGKDASLELELHQLFNKHKALRPVKMSIEKQRNANIHRGRMMHKEKRDVQEKFDKHKSRLVDQAPFRKDKGQ